MADDTLRDSVFRPAARIVSCDLGDGKALLNLATNRYFRLNESGKVAWAAIEERATRGVIVERIMKHFDVELDRCEADVAAILSAFSRAGLIETEIDQGR